MFQFTGLPSAALFYSGRDTRALPRVGFPIRTSRDQRMVSSFPGLFAAAHVLHRLSVPRHPPCALVLLIRRTPDIDVAMEFSRCTRAQARLQRNAGDVQPVSQNSAAYETANVEVDVLLGELNSRTVRRPSNGFSAYRHEMPVSLERR